MSAQVHGWRIDIYQKATMALSTNAIVDDEVKPSLHAGDIIQLFDKVDYFDEFNFCLPCFSNTVFYL